MKLKTLSGRLVSKNYSRYRMDWDCPERSKIQFRVKKFLEPYWKNAIVYREFPVLGTRLKIDIFNSGKLVAIEIDGDQHNEFNKFFHTNRMGYLSSLKRDDKKEKWCEMNNITLVRITTEDLDNLTPEWFLENYGVYL